MISPAKPNIIPEPIKPADMLNTTKPTNALEPRRPTNMSNDMPNSVNITNMSNPVKPNNVTVDDLLRDATPGRPTKGRTTQYVKPGSYDQTLEEFYSLNLSDVKDITTSYGPGKMGTLPDGRVVIARPSSSDTRPTLEIRKPNNKRGIEIRYGE